MEAQLTNTRCFLYCLTLFFSSLSLSLPYAPSPPPSFYTSHFLFFSMFCTCNCPFFVFTMFLHCVSSFFRLILPSLALLFLYFYFFVNISCPLPLLFLFLSPFSLLRPASLLHRPHSPHHRAAGLYSEALCALRKIFPGVLQQKR